MRAAHDATILDTKLYIPRARPNQVVRPRLMDRVNEAMDYPFTLISAPAGYGKTTLLSEWIPQSEHCVTWVSLDEGDTDPVRFWRHFLAALQSLNPQLCKNALQSLEGSQVPQIESVLSMVINELATLEYRFAHVFDDYHLVENPATDDNLSFLIEHLPSNLNLVITSRSDPALPLARWRARGQMAEIRSADLRFTMEEATSFFNQVMKLELSEQDVAALEDRTEGWISGLQLAALSIKDHDDRSKFIAAFTGSHRFIIDYLAEEVLSRQSVPVREFLLSTSILDRLCGPLCNALTGGSDGQVILEQLEQANLFIVPLDNDRGWYRYHHLFADVLQARMRQNQLERPAELHRRASEWYESHNYVAEAVQHALAAGELIRAARLIEQHSWTWLGRGEANTLRLWLDELPIEIVRSRPLLSLAFAWIRSVLEQPEMIEAHLLDAEAALVDSASQPFQGIDENVDGIRGEIASLRARIALSRSDIPGAIALCRHALDLIPEENKLMRGFANYHLGHGERRRGNIVEAERAYTEASGLGLQSDNLLLALHALANLSGVQITMGRLKEAAETSQRILAITAKRQRQAWPVAGLAYECLGRLHYEWNNLEAAARYLSLGIEYGQRGGLTGLELNSRLLLVFTLQSQHDSDGADEMVREIMLMNNWSHQATNLALIAAKEARLRLRQERMEQAIHWTETCGLNLDEADWLYSRESDYLTLARVLISRGKFNGVGDMLERLLKKAESDQRTGVVIEILIQQALLLFASDAKLEAFQLLERMLELSKPERYLRSFVDEGEPMRLLLVDLRAQVEKRQGSSADDQTADLLIYLNHLLAAFSHPQGRASPLVDILVEPLSERELEVLRLIKDGLTNQEIAERLVIAVSTVKSHINSLYGKLGTQRRTQTIAIARDLGLLSEK